NAPELIISDSPIDVYSFAVEGAFMAVDDLLPKVGIDPDSFFDGLDDLIKVDGKTYLVPQDANVHLLYYNKKLAREADLDPEAPPTTLEELDAWADALSIPDDKGGFKQLGLIPWIGDGGDTSGDAFHIPFVFGTNVYDPATNKLNLTEDKMIQYFEWIKGYSEKYAPTIQEWGTSAGGVFDPSCPFYTEKVAMYFCGNWMANAIKLTVGDAIEWGVTAVPAPDYGRAKATTLGANPFAIIEGSENAELAAFFIKFCISPAIQEDNFAQWRSIPCSDAAFDGVSLTKNGDAMYALEREIANNPENGVPAMCSVSTELADQFQKARQEIVFNGADITSTLQALQERMQATLDSAN
ncbi:MAG: extracellular solute-binding protein, partial [Hungatella hathewayi]|nr:extracellular solute-binding protein [Hungatella hathewayi]